MSRAPLAAAAAGASAAAMFLAVLTGNPVGLVTVYLAPLPLFLVAFALGPRPGLMAAGLAVLLVYGIGGGMVLPLTFLVVAALPAVVIGRQALLSRQRADGGIEWYPPGRLLLILTGLGLGLVTAATVLAAVFGGDGGLKGLVRDLLAGPLTAFLAASGAPGAPEAAGGTGSAVADGVASVLPGVVAVSWLVMVVTNGLFAQALLVRLNRLMRPPLRMTELSLPDWAPLVLAATAVGAATLEGEAGFLLVNLALVMVVPFFFAGLSVVHAFAARYPARMAILVGFYLMLFVLAWSVIAVIGLGVIEQWAGLRGRFAAATPDRGEA